MELATLSPVEVDELWAEALQPVHAAWRAIIDTENQIARYRKAGYAVEEGGQRDYLLKRVAAAEEKLAEARKGTEPFDAEFERRGGWTRYLLVVGSSNGHVHRVTSGLAGSSCPSLGVRTLVMPLAQFSGREDDKVVEECGHTACTKCFPDAPVLDAGALRAAKGYCAGSGTYAKDVDWRRMSPYKRCTHCAAVVAITSTGKYRAHKPAAS